MAPDAETLRECKRVADLIETTLEDNKKRYAAFEGTRQGLLDRLKQVEDDIPKQRAIISTYDQKLSKAIADNPIQHKRTCTETKRHGPGGKSTQCVRWGDVPISETVRRQNDAIARISGPTKAQADAARAALPRLTTEEASLREKLLKHPGYDPLPIPAFTCCPQTLEVNATDGSKVTDLEIKQISKCVADLETQAVKEASQDKNGQDSPVKRDDPDGKPKPSDFRKVSGDPIVTVVYNGKEMDMTVDSKTQVSDVVAFAKKHLGAESLLGSKAVLEINGTKTQAKNEDLLMTQLKVREDDTIELSFSNTLLYGGIGGGVASLSSCSVCCILLVVVMLSMRGK